ncbi:sin3 histone deacetylase corepressor complex component SDS3 isoform X1 [Hydra vulgaris]|uniref:sin3 histone deacetylase corepressor complex component SDS3 isoform X1 n=1 Tax=Hydra vulgaris TaxID=6087 RepID=UPI001F5FD056|nr:sin3 histone deacetylase corepressor complex component SDS3 isoform X1 [Hydra vulgaris]
MFYFNMTKEIVDDELLKPRKKTEEGGKKLPSKLSESNSPSTYSPNDECKSKRGRKPSQAKLAMLESKKMLADKRRFFDADNDGKRNIKKKKVLGDDQKMNKKSEIINNQKNRKKKKVKKFCEEEKTDSKLYKSKRGTKIKLEEEVEEKEQLKSRRSKQAASEDEDEISTEDELWWDDSKKESDDPWDTMFGDTDENIDNDFLQNSDEDTEDASETDMATLEEEMCEVKEKMYQEKIKELKDKLQQLERRTLPEYLEMLEELKKQKEDWIRVAYAFKAYEEKELLKEFEREKRQSKQDFERKKSELKELLINELQEKKKLIESEKSTIDLINSVGSILPMEVKPVVTRKLRRRPNDPPPVAEKKRKVVTAQLCFLLDEEQILADLKKINKNYKPEPPVITETAVVEKCDPTQFPDGTDAKIKDDMLYYNKEWYQSGDAIYLNSRDGERFNAQIHSITANKEIWIKKLTEGTRLKIYVGHLQRGKYSIESRAPAVKK